MANRTNQVTDFNSLTFEEQKQVLRGILIGVSGQWGEECYAAAELKDDRLFSIPQIMNWCDQLIEVKN